MGTDTELRHGIRTARLLIRRTWPSAARTVQAGCGARIWGQTRNLTTLNFQRGDRKDAWAPRYGDRHDVRYTDQERST